MNCYCYVLLDPRKSATYKDEFNYGPRAKFTHEPFYVGKGTGNRSDAHLKEAVKKQNGTYVYNNPKVRKIRKLLSLGLEPIVVHTQSTTTSQQALDREVVLISQIGRGRGKPLTNQTDGGEGATGAKRSKATIEKRVASLRRFYDSLSKIEKLDFDTRRSTNIKSSLSNRSDELKRKQHDAVSMANKKFWNNQSEYYRREHGRRIAKVYDDPEFLKKHSEKIRLGMASMSDTDKKNFSLNMSRISSRMHSSMSTKQKQRIRLKKSNSMLAFNASLSLAEREKHYTPSIRAKQESNRRKNREYIAKIHSVLAYAEKPMHRQEIRQETNIPKFAINRFLQQGEESGTLLSFGSGNKPKLYAANYRNL